jgi:hypothetical protein
MQTQANEGIGKMKDCATWPALKAALLLPVAPVAAAMLAETTSPLRHPAAPGFADLLAALAAWLLVGCAGWSALICTAALVETTTAGRVRATAWVGCPSSLRRVLLAGIAAALVSGVSAQTPVAATVTATDTASDKASDRGTAAGRPAPSWRVLPVPARPLGRVRPEQSRRVVVRPGDTLWHLATDRLRPSASEGEVALLVERIHHRNRELIGPDPDLIQPGQRLVAPGLGQHH